MWFSSPKTPQFSSFLIHIISFDNNMCNEFTHKQPYLFHQNSFNRYLDYGIELTKQRYLSNDV